MNAIDTLVAIAENTCSVDGSVESAEQALVNIREQVRAALLSENIALVTPQDDGCPGCHNGFEDDDIPTVCPNCKRTIITVGG